ILARNGQLSQALKMIEMIPIIDQSTYISKIILTSGIYYQLNQFQDAYAILKGALQNFPDHVDLRYELALNLEKLQEFNEMEAVLRAIIKDYPSFANAYNALGYSLAERNTRLEEARILIQDALKFKPHDPYIMDSLAWVEFRSGDLLKAKKLLEMALKSKPDPEIIGHLTEVLYAMGQKEQALSLLKRHLRRDHKSLLNLYQRLFPENQ
ncbi:MAG: tetratricopeptide repeat protein, partial [Gammaproteobacteria bacterium]|nr:tetratricopeptide repeat protein [Gammaproteobacteria bacterium]